MTQTAVHAQAFTPVITMVALFVARLEDPSSRLIIAVVLIALGTAIASYGEINMSVLGLIIMFASETFEAIRLVMTQILLVGLKFHPSEALGVSLPSALPSCLDRSDAASACLHCSGQPLRSSGVGSADNSSTPNNQNQQMGKGSEHPGVWMWSI